MRRLAAGLARIAATRRHRIRRGEPRSALHVSPIMFGADGMVGGGERAAYGFAQALAQEIPTTLTTTGARRETIRDGALRIEVHPSPGTLGGQVFDPLCYGLLKQLRGADVVHCHQYRVAVSQLAILAGAALGKPTFVTDMGGVGVHFDPDVPVERCLSGVLALSEFSLRWLPSGLPHRVIPTGVAKDFLDAGTLPDAGDHEIARVLFVGRIMRHKGIDVLLQALPSGVGADIVGHVYDPEFYELLQTLARDRDVRFIHNASDEQLIETYRGALVTVLPSVYRDAFGGKWQMPELLGCVLQESMASGTPVICSDVGGMPEIVDHGVSGFVVPPNDPCSLGQRISELARNPALRAAMGRQAHEQALERFAWPAIARRMLAAYREC